MSGRPSIESLRIARPLAKIMARHPELSSKIGPGADLFSLCYASIMVTWPRLIAYKMWKADLENKMAVLREHGGTAPQQPDSRVVHPAAAPGGQADANGVVKEGASPSPLGVDADFKRRNFSE